MKCPTCGAENDPANRFCDQCGTKLEGAAASAPVAAAAPAATAAAPTTCPNCGAAVLPGEAFCDECGAPLSAAPVVTDASAAAHDAPTVLAMPVVNAPAQTGAEETVVCPACGHHNLPGEAFCDNCGASLSGVATTTDGASSQPVTAAPDQSASAVAEPEELTAPPVVSGDGMPAENHPPAADELFSTQAAPQDVEATAAPPVEDQAQPAGAEAPATSAPVAETTAAPAPTQAQPDYEAERTRLTEEIARQDQIIAQFEQMQNTFGANTPAAVTQGLAEARDARAQAESALNALAPATPPVDPAEVARLQAEIAQQDQIIAQFEQMQAMFGASTPAAVTQGLADARSTRDQVAEQLQQLTGVAPVAAPTVSADAAAAPATPAPAEVPVAPEPAPAPAPQAHAPRLVVESSGSEITLPQDKAELIIGREDPISGIFPEVDLTPYGGETGGVSRQHAKLVHTNGQWAVVDLNSTNYTRVDGNKLDPNVPAPVRDGSRIQLGRVVVLFRE